ncbi:MAG TPA: hypothetical protein VG929_06460 [Actinomycetota bacterium]|nr:hypothetical protein [Actinomycetota bacterium]
MDSAEPTGCTLGSDELVERVSAWRDITSHAISRHVEADRVTSVYPKDADLLARLQRLIAAEASCCSFLKFTIEQRAEDILVQLTFPEDARRLVATAFGSDLLTTR